MSERNLPLVSFCQMCYNQERYIAQSLEFAFSQTYSPLEIIISDDASTDNSWEIIQNFVEDYHGPHTIVLNRNPTNLGMVGNWDKLCSLAKGELIFKGDGDDISLPNRVQAVVKDWLSCAKEPVLISHSYTKIDLDGQIIGHVRLPISGWDERSLEEIFTGNPFFHPGTGSAYNRILFERFGSCTERQAADDAVYVGRAVMTGRLRVIQDEYVMYRVGSGTTTTLGPHYRKTMIRGLQLGLHSQNQALIDLEKIKNLLSDDKYQRFKFMFEKRKRHHELVLKLWSGKTLSERLLGYKEVHSRNIFTKQGYISTILLFPHWIADFLLQLPLYIKSFFIFLSLKQK